MLLLRPDLKLVSIRGNLDTRIQSVLIHKRIDAVVVARAGLERLKKYLKFARALSLKEMLPAVGQAALGLEARSADKKVIKMLRSLNHRDTEIKVLAEREFLKKLRGGCRVPVGIISRTNGKEIYLKASVFSVRNHHYITEEIKGPKIDAQHVARKLALQLLKKGAATLLHEARND